MTNKILGIVRMMLLLLIIAFVVLFVIRYYAAGEFHYEYLAPIVGMLVFYLITKPRA